jgi:NAD(P)-dependent dehydrogenase (short-subunit alcohol dehydrogenase family)
MTISLNPLEGRHALVTGGARGIGLACARALLARGARVTLLGRDGAALETAVQELGGKAQTVQAVQADIADEASVRQAFARAEAAFGPVQVLVNNAGQASSQKFERTDAALWHGMLAVNLTGTFHCIQAALPGMLAARWGRVINVASTAGLIGYAYVSRGQHRGQDRHDGRAGPRPAGRAQSPGPPGPARGSGRDRGLAGPAGIGLGQRPGDCRRWRRSDDGLSPAFPCFEFLMETP